MFSEYFQVRIIIKHKLFFLFVPLFNDMSKNTKIFSLELYLTEEN